MSATVGPCRIRPVEMSDVPVLAALHRHCFPLDPWDEAAVASVLLIPGTHGFVGIADAPDGPEPVGFILCRAILDEAEILTFGVVADARRNGYGRALLSHALDEARARNVDAMFLEVSQDNLCAHRLYTATGFVQVGRRPEYYRTEDGKRIDAVILKYLLVR